ncbi:MAG: phosphoglucosamine mutase, partial [Candidatus Magasanikbacteria bacterium]|nr:phosphoglucosamine mutase [Candidatus Magasanikbacteria bacterium]
MQKHYFGTDGIRGLVGGEKINLDIAYRLGQALVLFCAENNLAPKIIIGHDTRWSSDELENALIAGIEKRGGEVLLVGTIPSPGMSYLSKLENVSLGVMITASHNDHRYNGFKIFTADGEKFSDENEEVIEELIDGTQALDLNFGLLHDNTINENYREKYEKSLLDIFQNDNFGDLKVVVDCANGATHEVAPNVFLKTKSSHVLHIFPDGKNINENCGSLYPEKLVQEVLKHKAHIGLAFDGDGDRITVVDELGNVLNGDHIMYILSRMMKQLGSLKNDTVVSTVM